MKKLTKRFIAAMLASVMLFTDCASGFAAEMETATSVNAENTLLNETGDLDNNKESEVIEELPEEETPQVLFEMEELREQSTKQYRLSDGTILAAQYGMDVHYEDENGEWAEIDNRFLYEEAENADDFAGYKSAEGALEFKFAPQVQDGEFLRITEDDYSVGFQMLPEVTEEEISVEIEFSESELVQSEEIDSSEKIPETENSEAVTEIQTELQETEAVVEEIPEGISEETVEETPAEEASSTKITPVQISFLKGEILNAEEVPAELMVASAVMSAEEEAEVVWAEVDTMASSEEAELLEGTKAEDAVTSVGYGNVLPGVSLQYVLAGSSLKEYILVNEKSDSYSYDFAMNLENLEPQMQEDGSILLADSVDGTVVYEIPAGYMTDAKGAFSDAVTMEISEGTTEEGSWILNVTADAEWINAEERVFPVQIDPTISHQLDSASYVYAHYVTEEDPAQAHPQPEFLMTGYSVAEKQMRSYIQLRSLPQLPKNSVICAAACYFGVADYSHYSFSEML